MVVNAQASTGIHKLYLYTVAVQFADEFGYPRESGTERLGGLDLRSDMNADPNRVQMFGSLHFLVDRPGSLDVDAELVLAQSGRYIRMGVGKNVGVHP